jgi:hypothetical protein
MRRTMTVAGALALAAALAAPAIAGDGDDQFEGYVEKDPGTYLGLNIDRQGGKRYIVDGLGLAPYTCIGDGQGYTPFGTGKRIRIRDNDRFSASQRGITFGGPVNLKITGKLNGRRIKGAVGWRLVGKGADEDCYTGQLAYRVSRDNEVKPPLRADTGLR